MLFKGLALGATLALASQGAAHAAPTPFTFTPSAVGLGAAPNTINANNFTVTDFASIQLNPGSPGSFTENGALIFSRFYNGGTEAASNGLGSAYSLYITFTATGTQPPLPTTTGTTTFGSFSSLTYTLYGQNTANPTVTVAPGGVTLTPNGPRTALAYGDLIDGTTSLTKTLTGFSPHADTDLNFNVCTASGQGGVCSGDESAFFTAPPPSDFKLLIGDFSANTAVTTLTSGSPQFLLINGGGGNLTIGTVSTPEPLSLSILGSGLIGLGLLGRKRRNA